MKARFALLALDKHVLVVVHCITGNRCTIEDKDGALAEVDISFIRFTDPVLKGCSIESITKEIGAELKERLKLIND